MPAAHPDNGGIQVFSRTQTAQQINDALASRGFEVTSSEEWSTAPNPTPTAQPVAENGEQPPADPQTPPAVAAPVAEPPAAAQPPAAQRPAKPGRSERLKAENDRLKEQLRASQEQTTRELAELRRLITTGGSRTPAADPAPHLAAPAAPAAPVVTAAPKVELPKRPQREDFLDSEDPEVAYEDAVANWTVDCRDIKKTAAEAEAERTRQQESVNRAKQTAEHLWEGELAAARREYSDFEAVMQKKHFTATGEPLAIVSPAMLHVSRNIEGGAKILYWLGTHPEEANKIAAQTGISDPGDTRAVEKAMRIVRREFDRIEQEIGSNPPATAQPAVDPETGLTDEEEDTDEPTEVDQNLPRVASNPAQGRRVEQAPSPGAVDTRPQQTSNPPQQRVEPKPEPIGRVGQRGVNVNRPVQALPPDVVKTLTPDEYRKRRAAEGSAVARGY